MTNGRRIGKASYAPAKSCAALIAHLGGPSQPQLRRIAYQAIAMHMRRMTAHALPASILVY